MAISTSPGYRAAAIGVAAAGLLVGAFILGAGNDGGAAPAAAATSPSSPAGRITVTGTGTVNGVPNQLTLSMSVQVTGYSVTSALTQANQDVRRVTGALRAGGVSAADIQTSDLQISPTYDNSGHITGYGVSESLSATLNQLSRAGTQIQAAVQAGGNAVSVDNVAVNVTNTGKLMAAARASAVADARAQALQFAAALQEPLGSVISISPVQQATTPLNYAAVPSASGKAGSVPISPGTQQLSVSITVVYAE